MYDGDIEYPDIPIGNGEFATTADLSRMELRLSRRIDEKIGVFARTIKQDVKWLITVTVVVIGIIASTTVALLA